MLRKQSKIDIKRTRMKKQQKSGNGGKSRRGRKAKKSIEDSPSENI